MTSLARLLLRLFPREFRDRFGAEMMAQIDQDFATVRARGRLPACWFALATCLDVLRSGLAERLNPSGLSRLQTQRKGKSIAYTSRNGPGTSARHSARSAARPALPP